MPGQTVANLFGALFVVLDALLFASFLSSSFDVVFYFLSEPLGVDFELPNRPSDPQKPSISVRNLNMFEKLTFYIQRWF